MSVDLAAMDAQAALHPAAAIETLLKPLEMIMW